MKTVLLENGGLLRSHTDEWVKALDADYVEVNSEVREYMIQKDFHFFALLIDPELENVCTSSAFITPMGFDACRRWGKLNDMLDWEPNSFMQLEYFAHLLFIAVRMRSKHEMKPLTIHINYEGGDFLQDVNDGSLGADVKTYLKLMLRQEEGYIVLKVYEDYKLVKTCKTEDDLNFTR